GLRDLPREARIEFVASSADGTERPVGVVEGMKDAVLEVLTSPKESLAFRVLNPFSAPRPTVARGWFVPTRGVADHGQYANNQIATRRVNADSASRRVLELGPARVHWGTATRLKNGERLFKHGKQVFVGVVRGIERIQ